MMPSPILKQKLSSIDNQDYGACQMLLGRYDFKLFTLIIQQIPKDPYAPPHAGIYRIQARRDDPRIVALKTADTVQNIASADFLARCFFQAGQDICKGIRGTGYSGLITINEPGQAILERNSVIITDQLIEIRCFLGIPADGRKINANLAETMFFEELPEIVRASLLKENINYDSYTHHINVMEDAEFLRHQLKERGLVAFIANGAILPRESGTSDRPLDSGKAVTFKAPQAFGVQIELPHHGRISGMGIPEGITLITGGGYHGKSTLLRTLERGIYNHIPGDGRTYCVSNPQTVKIRAYSGRNVVKTDISPFIRNLPFKQDTTAFCTENASGSTSQAATIIEAIEAGAGVLLMDEDTCATNFMIRDRKMQQLVRKEDEPITTFIDRVRQLYAEKKISTILVLGGIGDYFDVADHVIQLISYAPRDVTSEAHRITETFPEKRMTEDATYPIQLRERIPLAGSIDPCNHYGKFSIYAKEVFRLNFGGETVDLTDLEQLIELSQTKALGFAVEYARKYMDGHLTLREVALIVQEDIEKNGLDVLSDRISGHFARFRSLELVSALNRIRGFDVIQAGTQGDN